MFMNEEVQQARRHAVKILNAAQIILSREESQTIEVADFGLADLDRQGLELVTYINTDRYCAKELVLFPRQTCPQHKHPAIGDAPGKMETFRCRWGKVWLYVEGDAKDEIQSYVPVGSEKYYTVFHEVELNPGEQYTIAPDTWHWFQAGDAGAVVSEFSSTSRDEMDIFLDPRVRRMVEVDEQ